MAKNELTTANTTAVADSDIEALLNEYAGAGTSSAVEHNTVPMIYVLQSNSPQVNKRGDAYVQNAEPGDLWLKNAAEPIVKGTEGVLFQPVHFQFAWVEWKPNRGGFVATHSDRPADAEQKQIDPNDDRLSWVRNSNGNQVVETCYVYGMVNMELPYVIPLSSSGFKVARDWNTNARARKHNGKPIPLFATKYRLKTVFRSNDRGEWFTLGFDYEEGMPTKDQIMNGLEFFKSVSTGEKQAEAPQTTGDAEIPF
jgi:hypothetical protein